MQVEDARTIGEKAKDALHQAGTSGMKVFIKNDLQKSVDSILSQENLKNRNFVNFLLEYKKSFYIYRSSYNESAPFSAEKTKEVAHDIKEKLTPEVKDKDIAKAERKYNELKVKEDNDRFRAEGAEERRQELLSDAKKMEVC